MELEYAFVAKFADVHPDGYFSVIGGGVRAIAVAQLPASHAALAVMVSVGLLPDECQSERRMQLELFDPNGVRQPLEIDFPLPTPRRPEDQHQVGICAAINLAGVLFGTCGRHEFRISVDGRQLGVVGLLVTLTNAQQVPQP